MGTRAYLAPSYDVGFTKCLESRLADRICPPKEAILRNYKTNVGSKPSSKLKE